MKFFISIIMVLLMLNFFAQAQVVADPEGATAVKINDQLTVGVVDQGSSYATTMKGGPAGQKKTDTEGKEPDCEPGDGQRRCTSSPSKDTFVAQKGAATKGAPKGKTPKVEKAKVVK